ncbi:MAG TPA: TraX family protein [Clostridia bacterium]|nr:TraX family protein [Clostridia bacterium]
MAGNGEKTVPAERQRNDALKLVAMITMLIDHVGYMFFPQYSVFRSVGRLAFPIFAYLLSVGYEKTSSLKNYAGRLLLFGLISQVPYSFFSPGLEFEPLKLNIMFTLLAGLAVMRLYDLGLARIKEYRESGDTKKAASGAGILLVLCIAVIFPEVLDIAFDGPRMDYGFYGLLLVLIFHLFKDNRAGTVISYIALSFLYTYVYGAKVLAANSVLWFGEQWSIWKGLASFGTVLRNIVWYNNGLFTLNGYFFQARSIFALIPIFMSESLPISVRFKKYTAYWFYPVHIALLVLIARILSVRSA